MKLHRNDYVMKPKCFNCPFWVVCALNGDAERECIYEFSQKANEQKVKENVYQRCKKGSSVEL